MNIAYIDKHRRLVGIKPVRYTNDMVKKSTQSKTKKAPETADFNPNKTGFIVASIAAVSLVILGIIAISN